MRDLIYSPHKVRKLASAISAAPRSCFGREACATVIYGTGFRFGSRLSITGLFPFIKHPVFLGLKPELERFLVALSGQTYVYALCRPDQTPFYIGKGVNRRVLAHEAEARQNHPIGETNPFKCNVIRKILREGAAILYVIDRVFQREDELLCLQREAELISLFGRLHEGGPLTNLAGGLGNLSGSAPFSVARHGATLSGEPEDNPERAILNRFLLAIGPVDSVPIKPVSQISRILPSLPHPSARKPTLRCAYALIASASAHGLRLQAGVQIPRSFVYSGVKGVIENGVARDLLKAEMADLVPAADPLFEKFQLSASQVDLLISLVGPDAVAKRGLI